MFLLCYICVYAGEKHKDCKVDDMPTALKNAREELDPLMEHAKQQVLSR